MPNELATAPVLLEDPSVVELVIKKDVVIEACPTSNMQNGYYLVCEFRIPLPHVARTRRKSMR